MDFTHINARGEAHMVDIGEKGITRREARAQAVITMKPETQRLILEDKAKKGDVLGCARIAGIMAAKKTAELIPMCHIIPIDKISIDIMPEGETKLRITATACCTWKTGIEMETLTAAATAALTIYDMCKAVDRGMRIDEIMLLHKSGGKSGNFLR